MYESVTMKTKDNEQYECLLPTKVLGKDEHEEEAKQSKHSALELLKPLFDQTACSYKIDVYWNYELCHGRHARQYHESKSSGSSEASVTGFYLGYYKPQPQPGADLPEKPATPQTVLVDGAQLPYYEVWLRDGTVCDLSGQPRQTQVWYVCSLDGKGEIAELTETASCRYRIVVLTRLLCDHPQYRPKRTHVNQLHCLPRGQPEPGRKPAALADMEAAAERQVRASVQSLEGIFGADARVEILHKGGQVFIAVHTLPSSQQQQHQQQQPQQQPTTQQPPVTPELPRVPTGKFFSGSACIVGGTTWWRHQVCFQGRVTQFHAFDDGRKAEILLGAWDPEAHVRMATERRLLPLAAAAGRTELVQFYSGGDVCDLTGERRWAKVVLRCRGDESPTAVSIAFAEHRTCQYTVTLEARMLCPIIAAADPATGLVPIDSVFAEDEASATP